MEGNLEPDSLSWLLPKPGREARDTKILQPSPCHPTSEEHLGPGDKRGRPGLHYLAKHNGQDLGFALRQTWD